MTDTINGLDALRAELAALRAEVAGLRAERKPAVGDPPAEEEPPSNRRGFLRLAGAAAAGATVAAVAGSSHEAAALTGGNLLIGVSNAASNVNDTTRLYCPSVTALDDQTFRVDNYSTSPASYPTDHRIAVAGTASGADSTNGFRTGVYGRATDPTGPGGQGVFGSSRGPENPFTSVFDFGVFGTAPDAGWAVYGMAAESGTSAVGVKGRALAGTAVMGQSSTGLCFYAQGGGRILQDLRPDTGPPPTGSFLAGEMIRDAVGNMYLCTASGSPGTWRKVTAQHPNYPNAGGSINMLPFPIRLVDTRHDPNVPFDNGGTQLTPFVAVSFQVTGTVAQGLSVPAGATGIVGNFTVTEAFGPGYALVWPGGAVPATSNINYTGTTVGGGALANSYVCGLDSSGKMSMMCAVTPTHAILDIAGFMY